MKILLNAAKLLSLCLLLAAPVQARAQSDAPQYYKTYRSLLAKAMKNNDAARQLIATAEKKNPPNGYDLAYLGAAQAMSAKNTWNPISKINYAKRAQANLNRAVSLAPANMEIRFLRFTLDSNIPEFISLPKHLHDDKAIIIKLLRNKQTGYLDKEDISNCARFLIKSKLCTADEVAFLKTQLQ